MLDLEIEEPEGPRPLFTKGMKLYLVAMLCGSLMKACSKLLVERLDVFLVLFFRMVITGTIATGSIYYQQVEHFFWGVEGIRMLLFIRGTLGSFNIACTYFALKYLSLPDHAVISFLTPLTTSVLAKFALGEQYRWQQAMASCISLMGVLIIARPTWMFGTVEEETELSRNSSMRTLAVVSSLCVVFTASMVMIILRKIKDRAHVLTSVSNYAIQTVVFSLVVLTVRNKWELPRSLNVWLLIVAMGIFGYGLQYFSATALQMEETTVLANLKYTQLFYASVLEAIFWHDLPDIISIIGIVLILGGVALSSRLKHAFNAPTP